MNGNLAFGFSPSKQLTIITLLIIVLILTFVVTLIVKSVKRGMSWRFLITTTFLVPLSLLLIGLMSNEIYLFLTKPMTVDYSDLDGDYVINTNLFKGKNSNWQYDHYWIRISNDTLYLNVMDNNTLIKTHKRYIGYNEKGKHRFFYFPEKRNFRHDSIMYVRNRNLMLDNNLYMRVPKDTVYLYQRVIDSVYYARSIEAGTSSHHMLQLNPLLHADPFMFNVVLRSTKYQNMFLEKVNGRIDNLIDFR